MPHEPKRRHSHQRQGKHRQSIKLVKPAISICKNCGTPNLPHAVCRACGYYKGRLVVSK